MYVLAFVLFVKERASGPEPFFLLPFRVPFVESRR